MQSEKLFSHLQFGFLKGRSTSLQLLNIMNDWTSSIENGNFNDCIYLDYQKALDIVPHYAYNLDARVIKLHNHMSRKRSIIRRRTLPTHRKLPIICRKTDPHIHFFISHGRGDRTLSPPPSTSAHGYVCFERILNGE